MRHSQEIQSQVDTPQQVHKSATLNGLNRLYLYIDNHTHITTTKEDDMNTRGVQEMRWKGRE